MAPPHFYLTAILLALVIIKSACASSRCKALFNRQEKSAMVKFEFDKNQADEKHNYRIKFCSLFQTDDECIFILCNWGTGAEQDVFCTSTVLFKQMICNPSGNSLDCHIPSISPNHSGLYSCDLVPSREGCPPQPCQLYVPEEEKSHQDSVSGWMIFGILTIIIIAVLAGVIIVMALRCKRKKGTSKSDDPDLSKNQRSDQQQNPEEESPPRANSLAKINDTFSNSMMTNCIEPSPRRRSDGNFQALFSSSDAKKQNITNSAPAGADLTDAGAAVVRKFAEVVKEDAKRLLLAEMEPLLPMSQSQKPHSSIADTSLNLEINEAKREDPQPSQCATHLPDPGNRQTRDRSLEEEEMGQQWV